MVFMLCVRCAEICVVPVSTFLFIDCVLSAVCLPLVTFMFLLASYISNCYVDFSVVGAHVVDVVMFVVLCYCWHLSLVVPW